MKIFLKNNIKSNHQHNNKKNPIYKPNNNKLIIKLYISFNILILYYTYILILNNNKNLHKFN